MNGCQYMLPTFTLPANTAPEYNWDLAFLSKKEFVKKYKLTDTQYKAATSGPQDN